MERAQLRAVSASGGAGRVGGGGWGRVRRAVAVAACAVTAAGGVGCVTAGKLSRSMKEAVGLTAAPATQLTTVFQPQIQQLPDPTQDAVLRPGIVGQMFLLTADGSHTAADGDLYVMANDITPRPPGQPPAVPEIWHFDRAALTRLKTKDERFGDCYALFLPYPPNWKDVTQIQMSTQYKPKPESGPVGPTLTGTPATMNLDFSTPGKPLWTDVAKSGGKPLTAPAEVKAIPDLSKAIAQGKVGTPLTGPQAGTTTQQAAAATTAPLPPPVDMTNNPYKMVVGPNGASTATTAFALPPGQAVPPGWSIDPHTKAVVPPAGPNPWTSPPPAAVAPPAATPQTPGMLPQTLTPPAGVHPAGYQPATAPIPVPVPPANMIPAPGAGQPIGALPPATSSYPMTNTPAGVANPLPVIPPTPGGGAPVGAAGFDPNSAVGPWANTPTAPSAPGFPPMTLPVPQSPNPSGMNTMTIRR